MEEVIDQLLEEVFSCCYGRSSWPAAMEEADDQLQLKM